MSAATTLEPYTIDANKQWSNTQKILHKFSAYRIAYKHIDGQPVHAFFVIPKQLPPGPRPLLVRFHGGGWSEGEADASLRPFFLDLALKHGAVVLTPDYRLRPEHEMTDGVEDVRSFWKWVEQDVHQLLSKSFPGLDVDVSNLLIGGESAGGYHTIQTALLGMTTLPIKVLFVQYPPLHMADMLNPPADEDWGKPDTASIFAKRYPYSIVEDYLASVEPGKILTRAKYGTRMDLMAATCQASKFVDLTGDNAWVDPWSSVETAGKLPPILLYQSKEDEAVPYRYAVAWVEKFKKLQPDVPLFFTLQTGDHVFDKDHNMETPWLKEPLEFVQSYWPATSEVVSTSA